MSARSVLERTGIVVSAPIWGTAFLVSLLVIATVNALLCYSALTGLPYIFTGRFNGWSHWFLHKTGFCDDSWDERPLFYKPCPYHHQTEES